MPVVPGGAYQQGPTCFDRMKLGFTIGFCVGMASGALFGGFSALRYFTRVYRKYWYMCVKSLVTMKFFYYQVWNEGKGIVKQRWQGNASRRRHVRYIYGHRHRDTMLAGLRYRGSSQPIFFFVATVYNCKRESLSL